MIDKLIAALDLQSNRWWTELAGANDLETYISTTLLDERTETSYFPQKLALDRLKKNTASRLFIVLRAAVQSGLVADLDPLRDALDSAEENAWDLIDRRSKCLQGRTGTRGSETKEKSMKLSEIKAGDILIADGGFTCIEEGRECEVFSDLEHETGGGRWSPLFVRCCGEKPDFRSGETEGSSNYQDQHFLDGQIDEEGDEVIGFRRK